MSDNIPITPGTGASVATDDVSGIHFQKVKLDIGGDGLSSPVTAANPLPVALTGTTPVSLAAAVELGATSLAALETISVANFPATQPVSLAAPVALDAASLAALEVISVANFPATQPVSLAAPVGLDATALAALESITVQQSALPTGAATETTLAAISAAAGAPADAAATADTGAFSLIALVKRLLAKFPGLGIKNTAGSMSIAPASDAVFLTRNPPATLVDFSGTAGVAAVDKLAANPNRRGFWILNESDAVIRVNTMAAAVLGSPSLPILPGAYYETPPGGAGTGAISIIGSKAGQAFTAREW